MAKAEDALIKSLMQQSFKICSKHGCLDCTCDPADGGSAVNHAAAAKS